MEQAFKVNQLIKSLPVLVNRSLILMWVVES